MIIGEIHYPFFLKSRANLLVGQFWSMPIFGKRFACGRILRLPGAVGSRQARLVVVGIYEWLGWTEPTPEVIVRDGIAGQAIVVEGLVHTRALRENQAKVQTFRRRTLDGIKAGTDLDALPRWSGEEFRKVVVKALRGLR